MKLDGEKCVHLMRRAWAHNFSMFFLSGNSQLIWLDYNNNSNRIGQQQRHKKTTSKPVVR